MSCIILEGDAAQVLKTLEPESVHLVVTSPPYDNLRSYGQSGAVFTFDFETIARELYRVLVPGGVICWVVANQVKQWGESLTAERQRIQFQEIGFAVRKIIYHKLNFANPNATFYHRLHEDVTICCKGKRPQAWNPVIDVPTVWKKALGRNTQRLRDGTMVDQKQGSYGDLAKRGDVWIGPTSGQENPCRAIAHPATMPKWLTEDLIKSWSNENNVILDPFAGSGTTGKAAISLNRSTILVDINPDYTAMCHSIQGNDNSLKNNLTDKQRSVNSSTPARCNGQTTINPNTTNDMNSKQLALISGVLACAFGQIKNILSGETTEACDAPAPKTKEKTAPAKAKSKPEPVEEEEEAADDEDITVNVEEEDDAPDYDALRTQALSLVGKLFKADVDNKKKIKAILTGLGETTVGEMEEENLPKFIAKAKKLAA